MLCGLDILELNIWNPDVISDFWIHGEFYANDIERSWPWREKLIGCKIGAMWVAEENEVAPRTQDKSFDKISAPEIDNHADLA